ncbi:glutathione S-transferase family protein [Rhodopseudomonas boonkerdii]|nr:glutathione S-transferase family protein [Rhodopseudomonas boonkerdii]
MIPIDFYTFATPNGRKVAIMLEELELSYESHIIDIERGEQKSPEFLRKNPNGKIPVVVDHATNKTIFESCAILLYLAETYGPSFAMHEDERLELLQWLFFQVGHIGPMIGQLWHFKEFASEQIPSAISRYEKECYRLFSVLDDRLVARDYINGRYSISDIATWPWIDAANSQLGLSFEQFPHLKRWHAAISERPAVIRSASIGHHSPTAAFTPDGSAQ